jgi:hypothetical protein
MRRKRKSPASNSKNMFLLFLVLAVATSSQVGITITLARDEQPSNLRPKNNNMASQRNSFDRASQSPLTTATTRSADNSLRDVGNVDRSSLFGPNHEPPPRGSPRKSGVSSQQQQQQPPKASRAPRSNEVPHIQSTTSSSTPEPQCRFIETSIIFWHLGATPNNDDNGPGGLVGSSYVFNNNLLNSTLEIELADSYVSGVCTRTQVRQPVPTGGDDSSTVSASSAAGAGYCRLTYTIKTESDNDNGSSSSSSYTFNAAGEVFDSFGGTMAVAGGTGPMIGVAGEVRLLPYNADYSSGAVSPSDTDIFLETDLFLVKASLFQNSCLRDASSTSTTTHL